MKLVIFLYFAVAFNIP